LTRDKAQLERTNDVIRAQLDLLEQQNRSIMQQQQHRGFPMQHMQQPQMMQHPQHQMGMMNQGQPIYITPSGQHVYATAQPGQYIEVQQQPQQPGAPVGMPSGGTMTQVHGRPGYQTVGPGTRIVQQQGQSTNGSQQAPQTSSPGGSTSAPAAGGSMDSNPKYFLS
jgi:hypothetical protein